MSLHSILTAAVQDKEQDLLWSLWVFGDLTGSDLHPCSSLTLRQSFKDGIEYLRVHLKNVEVEKMGRKIKLDNFFYAMYCASTTFKKEGQHWQKTFSGWQAERRVQDLRVTFLRKKWSFHPFYFGRTGYRLQAAFLFHWLHLQWVCSEVADQLGVKSKQIRSHQGKGDNSWHSRTVRMGFVVMVSAQDGPWAAGSPSNPCQQPSPPQLSLHLPARVGDPHLQSICQHTPGMGWGAAPATAEQDLER